MQAILNNLKNDDSGGAQTMPPWGEAPSRHPGSAHRALHSPDRYDPLRPESQRVRSESIYLPSVAASDLL